MGRARQELHRLKEHKAIQGSWRKPAFLLRKIRGGHMARPKKKLDIKDFEKLCAIQCTQDEICGWFNVTDKTLTRWCMDTYGMSFSDVFKLKRGRGKIALRRMQFQLAEKSASMAIFLGKNYLGQTDGDYLRHDYNNKILDLKEREVKMKEEGF